MNLLLFIIMLIMFPMNRWRAPEVEASSYNYKIDIFSLGVVYVFFCFIFFFFNVSLTFTPFLVILKLSLVLKARTFVLR